MDGWGRGRLTFWGFDVWCCGCDRDDVIEKCGLTLE